MYFEVHKMFFLNKQGINLKINKINKDTCFDTGLHYACSKIKGLLSKKIAFIPWRFKKICAVSALAKKSAPTPSSDHFTVT